MLGRSSISSKLAMLTAITAGMGAAATAASNVVKDLAQKAVMYDYDRRPRLDIGRSSYPKKARYRLNMAAQKRKSKKARNKARH